MIKTFCVYKARKYELDIDENSFVIYGNEKDISNGFKEYIDIQGNKHLDISCREISENEMDYAYEACVLMEYQSKKFEVWSIRNKGENKIFLYTNNPVDAQKHDFVMKEQFVFLKEVEISNITRIIEHRRGILKFVGESKEVKITEEELYNYY